jgi:hypothetical protein
MTSHGEILVYRTDDGTVRLDVRLQDETVWLTQAMMAELFGTTQQNISSHLANIYDEKELLPEATHKKYLLVRREGNRAVQREVDHYNLDAIISVGYRVKSKVATRFRIWATERLKEYIVKGFAMDDARLRVPLLPRHPEQAPLRRDRQDRYHHRQWERKLDEFLRFNDRDVLPNAGSVSKQAADEHAAGEYEEFSARQREFREAQGATDYLRQLEDIARNEGTDNDR